MDDELFKLWPTHILRRKFPKHEECKEGLIRFVDEYMVENPTSRSAIENTNLYESEYGIIPKFHEKSAVIREPTEFMCDSFPEVATLAKDDCWRGHDIDRSKLRVKIAWSWFINYLDGGYVKAHTHGNCAWFCVYYLQKGSVQKCENGCTYFMSPDQPKDPDLKKDSGDVGNMYLEKSQWSCKAKKGYALFFPPLISHGSFPYAGNTRRIIFSANAQLVLADQL